MRSGKDSTLKQMAELIKGAQENKSRSERLADRFAGIFLPVVLMIGVITYIFTRDIFMTAALFLVACADDMAVAIPLAITASLGQAAKRGVVVKGGEWLGNLGKIDTLVLDKTGRSRMENSRSGTLYFWRIRRKRSGAPLIPRKDFPSIRRGTRSRRRQRGV